MVLTHHHPDHIGAANACSQRYGVPILAHPLTAQALRGRVEVQQYLDDGACLDLGRRRRRGRWHLQAIHTPGHAPGHLAFYEPRYRLLFVGDMVSTLSSVVIAAAGGRSGGVPRFAAPLADVSSAAAVAGARLAQRSAGFRPR